MRMPLNLEDLIVESVVVDPGQDESSIDSQLWYTNTRPVQRPNTNESSCYA